jgi:5'-3' exonuclease
MSTITNRIVKIYQILEEGHPLTAPQLADILNEPLGTVSSFCSFMYHTRNLKRNEKNCYFLPAFKKAPVEVAKEIQRYLKNKRQEKAKFKDENEPVLKLNFERMDSEAIEAAIELLKSSGYKILKPTTEFKEI